MTSACGPERFGELHNRSPHHRPHRSGLRPGSTTLLGTPWISPASPAGSCTKHILGSDRSRIQRIRRAGRSKMVRPMFKPLLLPKLDKFRGIQPAHLFCSRDFRPYSSAEAQTKLESQGQGAAPRAAPTGNRPANPATSFGVLLLVPVSRTRTGRPCWQATGRQSGRVSHEHG